VRKLLFATLTALSIAGGSSAAQAGSVLTGQQLLQYCTSSKSDDDSLCVGYIAGIADEMSQIAILSPSLKSHLVEIPKGTDSTEMVDAVVSYLKTLSDHPQPGQPDLSYAAAPLVMVALRVRYR
jgi:hypothetical protein